jgi:hypothetical protein
MVYIRCDWWNQQCGTNIDVRCIDDGDDNVDREHVDSGFFIANRNIYRSYIFVIRFNFGISDAYQSSDNIYNVPYLNIGHTRCVRRSDSIAW